MLGRHSRGITKVNIVGRIVSFQETIGSIHDVFYFLHMTVMLKFHWTLKLTIAF